MEPPAGDAEAQALSAWERGDMPSALTLLCRALGAPVYRYCLRMVGEAALADDVHQSVFAQACEDLPRFERRSSLRSWLFAIAHHRCLDALKSGRRFAQRFELSDEPPQQADPSAPPDEQFAARALATSLGDCLQGLPAHVRMAVLLRHQEGFGYEEMARISREKAGTLQARVARAMLSLRECLEGKGVAP